jgi:hypothetical protein
MPLPENPNLDDNQDEQDPGNEYEQPAEGEDTGNQLLDTNEADTDAIDAATRASESAFTLNLEDGIADKEKE